MSDEQVESWAVVELLGHVTMAGRLTEEERFGSKMGRVDIPTNEGGFTTVFFGGGSVYRITPCTEVIARAKARSHQPHPIYAYELPKAEEETTVKESQRSLDYYRDDYADNQHDSRDDSREEF
jgi:hypothetical protein